MTYPTAVVIVAIIVTGILLVKVVPQFQSVFCGFGAELPAFTLMVIGLSRVHAAMVVGDSRRHWWQRFSVRASLENIPGIARPAATPGC